MLLIFLRDALRQAAAAEWRWLALALFVLATATNMVVLSNMPEQGAAPPPAFLFAAVIRIAGLLLLTIALMRRAVASPRPAFLPDGAFWLSVLFAIFGFGVAVAVRFALPGGGNDLFELVASNALSSVLIAPLTAWMVALATAKPLAIDPRPWFGAFPRWLFPLIVWQLLIVVPLAALHAYIDIGLVEGAFERSLWLELLDGAISTLMLLAGFALAVTAYRRVANR